MAGFRLFEVLEGLGDLAYRPGAVAPTSNRLATITLVHFSCTNCSINTSEINLQFFLVYLAASYDIRFGHLGRGSFGLAQDLPGGAAFNESARSTCQLGLAALASRPRTSWSC